MTDFSAILIESESPGMTVNPFAARQGDTWISGHISIEFLNVHFGHLTTATEMIAATKSDGLKLFFQWLADEGKIPQ